MPSNPIARVRQHPLPQSNHPPFWRFRMPSLFNLIRTCIYLSVLLFTVICLAMAGHFQSVLAASDLTRFVPFAIFVCSASMFIISVLLLASFFLRERNPISTRIELACLGLVGIFWLVLGTYLTTSESQSADVECFNPNAASAPLDDSAASFHTEQYQAMYRVLMTFSLINAVLVLLFCLGLLFLAVRRHRKGDEHMWHGPVTSCAWFNNYGNSIKRNNSGTSSILPTAVGRERSKRSGSGPYANGRPRYSEKTLPSRPPGRQPSGGSTLIGSHSTNEFERGGMINPNRKGSRHGSA